MIKNTYLILSQILIFFVISFSPINAEEIGVVSEVKNIGVLRNFEARKANFVKKKRLRKKKRGGRNKIFRKKISAKPKDQDKIILSEIVNLYLDENYERVVSVASKQLKNPRLKRSAHYYIALSLASMEYYRSSLYFFGRLIQLGPGGRGFERRYYEQAVSNLVKIAHEIPDDTVIPYLLKGLKFERITGRKSKKFYYYLGKYYYMTGQYDETLKSMRKITRSSPYFSRARYVMGVVFALQKKFKLALKIFRKITTLPYEDGGYDNRLIIDKANLALARLFYGFGKHKLSQVFYEKISDESPIWMTAVFESSWAYFVNKDYNKVLGKLEIINSPFFSDKFVPEFALLRGIVMLRMCRVVELKPSIIKFNKAYTPLVKPLYDYIDKYKNNIVRHYKAIENYYTGKDYYMGLPKRVVSHIAMEDAVFALFYKIFSVQDERQDIIDNMKGSDNFPFYATLVKKLGGYVKDLKSKVSGHISKRIIYQFKNLGDQIDRSRLVRLQYMGEEKTMMEKSMVLYEKNKDKKYDIGQKSVEVPENYIYWPFEGEYWIDELGFYEFRMEDVCDK